LLESERGCLVRVVQEYPSFFKPNTNGNVFQYLKTLFLKFPFHKSLDILFPVLIATFIVTFIFFRLEKQVKELKFPCFYLPKQNAILEIHLVAELLVSFNNFSCDFVCERTDASKNVFFFL
jgi:hypothetical protein